MGNRECLNCKFLIKYFGEAGDILYVCDAKGRQIGDAPGVYLVDTVDVEQFDPSYCGLFKTKASTLTKI